MRISFRQKRESAEAGARSGARPDLHFGLPGRTQVRAAPGPECLPNGLQRGAVVADGCRWRALRCLTGREEAAEQRVEEAHGLEHSRGHRTSWQQAGPASGSASEPLVALARLAKAYRNLFQHEELTDAQVRHAMEGLALLQEALNNKSRAAETRAALEVWAGPARAAKRPARKAPAAAKRAKPAAKKKTPKAKSARR
jgi:hypothetical protein